MSSAFGKWATAIAAIAVLAVMLGCASSSGSNVQQYKMNEDVMVGKALWKVLKAEKQELIKGSTGGGSKAEGIFILVETQVKNTSSENFMLTGVEAEIVDESNTKYSFDAQDNAMLLSSIGRENLVNQNVASGQTVKGWLIFDVGQDARGLKIKLRDLDIRSQKVAAVDLNM